MITIGLTGSIGMGKTETAKCFARKGVVVFDSDLCVHKLLGPQGGAVDEVEHAFSGVQKEDYVDRKILGARVFGNDNSLEVLEKILHPLVVKERETFIKNAKADIILFDIPLLFENGYENDFDYIVVVSASAEAQKKRVLERSGMTKKRFKEILAKQSCNINKAAMADFIIQTDRGFDYAEKQVVDIIKQIRKY
ncbi:dephospho-CoA kinase [Emcibacteraceae bacterium]|nr:dephospho-CoA kinase [Emcibacteraceae bacterium]